MLSESVLIHLGTCLQILVGDQMMKRYTADEDVDEDDDEDDDTLSDEQIFAAFRDANVCFKDALTSAV